MNNIDMYIRMIERSDLPSEKIVALYNAMRNVVIEELKKEHKVDIEGFGIFYAVRKKSNNNLLPKFQPGKKLTAEIGKEE